MKKIFALLLVAGSTLGLTACGGMPTCNDELDKCARGGAYSEERTVEAGRYKTVLNKKEVPTPAPAPAPAPVAAPVPAPIPAPVVIDDTAIMRSAEPEFKQISK